MTTPVANDEVFVEAPARLHFGVLDLRGALGRWFGGIGAAAPAPTLLLSARRARSIAIEGEDATRAEVFVRRFMTYHQLDEGVRVHVRRALPVHAGLGSGTQLAMAVARALSELWNISADPIELACAVGRTSRSAVGTWTFAGGGLVLEGGRRRDTEGVAPLLARIPFPKAWRCVVGVPNAAGMSGEDEAAAFAQLPLPPEHEVEQVAHLVLMALLPSVAEGDLDSFGAALTEIQSVTGRWFAAAQGGAFASGASAELIKRMVNWGVPGVGQSSWGPTVYGIVGDEETAQNLVDRMRNLLGPTGKVYEGPFRSEGARVWRNTSPQRREGAKDE